MGGSQLLESSGSNFVARTRALQAYCLLVGAAFVNAAPAVAQGTIAPSASGDVTADAPAHQSGTKAAGSPGLSLQRLW